MIQAIRDLLPNRLAIREQLAQNLIERRILRSLLKVADRAAEDFEICRSGYRAAEQQSHVGHSQGEGVALV